MKNNNAIGDNAVKAAPIIVVCFALAACQATQQKPQPQKTYSPIQLNERQKAEVRAGTAQALKDPQSAQFGSFVASREDTSGNIIVCGTVNARNSFGGYTGAQPFVGMLITVDRAMMFRPVMFGSNNSALLAVRRACGDAGISLI